MITKTLSINARPAAVRAVVFSPREGLHLRVAARVIHMARQFQSPIKLIAGAASADARSILQLLELGAAGGRPVTVAAEGPDAQEAVRALSALFEQPSSQAINRR